MDNEHKKREWVSITIQYKGGLREEITRKSLEEIEKVVPVLYALNSAKQLKNDLENILT
ncbi:unnamed protein product [marine sediment metagenome]|uniref:Uncharacterized protein n=1 Tax=marine sediment metagenome TaxID=412755 RepID=X1KSM9_9ZZZZ